MTAAPTTKPKVEPKPKYPKMRKMWDAVEDKPKPKRTTFKKMWDQAGQMAKPETTFQRMWRGKAPTPTPKPAPQPQPQASAPEPEPSRPGLLSRTGQQFLNRLVLRDAESARPSTAVGESAAFMEAAIKSMNLPDKKPSFWEGVKNIPNIWWGLTKTYYGKPEVRQRGRVAAQAARMAAGGGRPWEFQPPPAESAGEKIADIAGGLSAFLLRLWASKRIASRLPIPDSANLQEALAWELVNTEGPLGTGALMGSSLRAINAIGGKGVLAQLGKTGGESALFAGLAHAQGAELADTVIAALIPPAMRGFRAARGALTKKLVGAKTVREAWAIVKQGRAMRLAALQELGLGPNATNAEIRQAYHQIATRTHPDLIGPKHRKVFERASDAHALLTKKKMAYQPEPIRPGEKTTAQVMREGAIEVSVPTVEKPVLKGVSAPPAKVPEPTLLKPAPKPAPAAPAPPVAPAEKPAAPKVAVPPKPAKAKPPRPALVPKAPEPKVKVAPRVELKRRLAAEAKAAAQGYKAGKSDYAETQARLIELADQLPPTLRLKYHAMIAPAHEEGEIAKPVRPGRFLQITNRLERDLLRSEIPGTREAREERIVPVSALLRYALRHQAKGAAKGWRAGQIELEAKQTGLLEFARTHLPKQELHRVLPALKSLKTPAQRKAAAKALNRIVANYDRAEASQEFRKTIKALRKTKLRPEYATKAGTLLDSIALTLPTEKTLAKAEKLMQYLGTSEDELSGVPGSEITRAQAALARPEKTPTGKLSADAVRSLSKYFQHVVRMNEKKNEIIFGRRKRKADETIAEAATEVRGKGPTKTRVDFSWERDRPAGLVSRLFTSALANHETNLFFLVGDKGAGYQVLWDNLREGQNRSTQMQLDATEYLSAKLELLGIGHKQLLKMSDTYARRPGMFRRLYYRLARKPATRADVRDIATPGATFADTGRAAKNVQVTPGEMIALLVRFDDASTRHEIIKDKAKGITFQRTRARRSLKLTHETILAIRKQATETERQVMHVLKRYVNGPLKDELNKAWVDQKGFEIAKRTDYWPRVRDPEFREAEPDQILNQWIQRMLDEQGIFKPRTGAVEPVLVGDAFAEFAMHVNRVAAMVGKHPAVLDAQRMLGNPEFRRAALSRRMGLARYNKLKKQLRSYVALDWPDQAWLDRVMRGFARKAHVGALALKPQIGAYQPVSYALATNEIPLAHWARGLTPGLGSRGVILAELRKHAPGVYARLQGGAHQILTPSNLGPNLGPSLLGKQHRDWKETTLGLITAMDHATIRRLYRACKAWAIADGLKGDAMLAEAGKRTQRVVDRTQPTWDTLTRTGFSQYASEHAWALPASMFTSQTSKNWNMAARAVAEYGQSKKSWRDAARFVRKFGVPTIIQSAVIYAIYESWRRLRRWGKPEREPKDLGDHIAGAIKRMVGGVQVVGPIAAEASDRIQRKLREKPAWATRRTGNVFYDTMQDVQVAIEAWVKVWQDAESRAGRGKYEASLLRAVLRSISPLGILFGWPIAGFKALAEPWLPGPKPPSGRRQRRSGRAGRSR